MGSCGYESFAERMVLELLEVVDEHFGELVGFLGPFSGICVSVARIEDLRINAREFGRDGEVEDGELLGGSGQDSAVEDSVDNAAGILDGDTFAGSVPACVDEISLGTALLHALNEFFSIFGGVQRKECCAEASGECGSRFGDAALCSCEFRGETGEEVIFGLLGSEDRHGRKHTECVS